MSISVLYFFNTNALNIGPLLASIGILLIRGGEDQCARGMVLLIIVLMFIAVNMMKLQGFVQIVMSAHIFIGKIHGSLSTSSRLTINICVCVIGSMMVFLSSWAYSV